MNKRDVSTVVIVVALCVFTLATLSYAIHRQCQCTKSGGVMVRGMWFYECMKAESLEVIE